MISQQASAVATVGLPASARGVALLVPAVGPWSAVKMGLGGPAALGWPGWYLLGRLSSDIIDLMMGSPGSSIQDHVVMQVTAVVALSTIGWALLLRVGKATFGALGVGDKGILMYGGQGGCSCCMGGEVGQSFSLAFWNCLHQVSSSWQWGGGTGMWAAAGPVVKSNHKLCGT